LERHHPTEPTSAFPSDGIRAVRYWRPGIVEAIFQALNAASHDVIKPVKLRLLVIPIRSDRGCVIGGLWGVSLFRWLHLEMLFVPAAMGGRGVGSGLLASAETGARRRGCLGIYVDSLSFQAAAFCEESGFPRFGVLDDCPPGPQRLFLHKRLTSA
jgi:GNAT superfamily N-acetyltransferase